MNNLVKVEKWREERGQAAFWEIVIWTGKK